MLPPLDVLLEKGPDGAWDFHRLPAKPGALVIEDHAGRTVTIVTTANLRRAAMNRLGDETEETAKRRANLRPLAARVMAMRVGSAFEADWVYTELTRERLPHVHQSLLDCWQPWFVTCEIDAAFPRWVKTNQPKPSGAAESVVTVGPFADQQSAAAFIEILENTFDLCRYYAVLTQAPHGAACAYKEMGRCDAPCDGSVSMDHYRARIRESVRFATMDHAAWTSEMQARIAKASSRLAFEEAQQLARMMKDAAPAAHARYRWVDDMARFRFVAVQPSGRTGWARLFAISAGEIHPLADIEASRSPTALTEIADAMQQSLVAPATWRMDVISLMCRHLFKPPRARTQGEFLKLDGEWNAASLAASIRRVASKASDDADAADAEITEQTAEEA